MDFSEIRRKISLGKCHRRGGEQKRGHKTWRIFNFTKLNNKKGSKTTYRNHTIGIFSIQHKSVQMCPKVSKSDHMCPKVSRCVQKCPKVSKSVNKVSKSIQKGPTGSAALIKKCIFRFLSECEGKNKMCKPQAFILCKVFAANFHSTSLYIFLLTELMFVT